MLDMGAKRLAELGSRGYPLSKHKTKLGIDTANRIIELAKNTPARPLDVMESDILSKFKKLL